MFVGSVVEFVLLCTPLEVHGLRIALATMMIVGDPCLGLMMAPLEVAGW
jgi:hypothetical protein